jgi:hypothetical protein
MDWKFHKEECLAISEERASGPMRRASITLAEELLGDTGITGTGAPRSPEVDAIYYLKTALPHRRDVSISGPYYPLETVKGQIMNKLAVEKGTHGYILLEETLENVSIQAVESLQSVLLEGGEIVFEILRDNNPEVAVFLRSASANGHRPVYGVVAQDIDSAFLARGDRRPEETFIPVQDARVVDAFTTKEAANRLAGHLLDRWLAETPGATIDKIEQEDGTVVGFLMQPAGTVRKTVVVHSDDELVERQSPTRAAA